MGSVAASFFPRTLRRLVCCAGMLLLVQNLLVLSWGSRAWRACEAPGLDQLPQPEQTGARIVRAAEIVPNSNGGAASSSEASSGGAGIASERPAQTNQPAVGLVQVAQPQSEANSTLTMRRGNSLDDQPAAVSAPLPGQLQRSSSLFSVPRERLRLFGQAVPKEVQLCVSFGSVRRKKDYVLDTVGTMLGMRIASNSQAEVSEAERQLVVIVSHFADFNVTWVHGISKTLQQTYSDLIRTGHFHGIHAPEELYPNLNICPPFCSYGDDPHRVKWRSKQNVDYAFLMYYAAPLAPYYLQVEDDLDFAPHWIAKISDFVQKEYPAEYLTPQNTPWRLIDFSSLGFIGKMFQSKEVTRMAQFLLLFYDQMPCDILIAEWVLSMGQEKRIAYWRQHPPLFQHVGMFRSLDGGIQPLQDKQFATMMFDNPPGVTVWNLTTIPTFDARFAYFAHGEPRQRKDVCDYDKSPGLAVAKHKTCWLWCQAVQAGQHLTVIFAQEIKVKALFAHFRMEPHKDDLLEHAAIEVAGAASQDSSQREVTGSAALHAGFWAGPGQWTDRPAQFAQDMLAKCGEFRTVAWVEKAELAYWEEGVSDPPRLSVDAVQCVRIIVLRSQEPRMVISQLQVRSK